MNNFIEYFYNIKITDINYNQEYYSFNYLNNLYRLYEIDSTININNIWELDKKLLKNSLVNEIVLNKDGIIISNNNGKSYILMKLYVNPLKNNSLAEINDLNNKLISTEKNDWGTLWSNKIDYLEKFINENGKKYPIITDSFNYFVGLTENAIAYFNSINIPNNYISFISHKVIRYNDKIDTLYNPINIIFDYKVRDIAEYIKNAFFLNNKNIFNEINIYLLNNNLSLIDIKLLIARLLYPSFYFYLYDDIIVNNKSESIILDIVNRLAEYEEYLGSVIEYFNKKYGIREIMWLKKKTDFNQSY